MRTQPARSPSSTPSTSHRPRRGISGNATLIPRDPAFAHFPVVFASAATGGDAIVTSILANPQSRSNHVQQIVAKVQEADLAGVDISYLDLKSDQRSSFALFIGELSTALRRQDRKLTVTLPPPLLTNDHVDEGAYDWAAIGAAADLVKMTPFRDQSRYRLDVPRILDHLTSVVDRQKLILTVTPYATELSSDGASRLCLWCRRWRLLPGWRSRVTG
jgi:spore germination protein YaaH